MQDLLIHVKNTCPYCRTETIQMMMITKAANTMLIIFKFFLCFVSSNASSYVLIKSSSSS